jgi:uronate dehydrogenase
VTPAPPRVLVTGSSGSVGRALVAGLPDRGWTVRQLDLRPPEVPLPEPHDAVVGDCFDPAVLDAALPGCEAVVHLAAVPGEAPIEEIAASHVVGTARVLAAAVRHGARRAVVASSNHAVGFTPRAPMVGLDLRPRPDSNYGVGKVATEALCSLTTDRDGLATVCLRIGTLADRPRTRRHLATWLSPGDLVRLVDAALRAPDVGHAVVYGISDNTRAWWDQGPARSLGYVPQDDAERYADEVLATTDEPTADDPDEAYLGGGFAIVAPRVRTEATSGRGERR